MKFTSDIDIDFADRAKILSILKHIPASRIDKTLIKHATGVYFTEIPVDPTIGVSSLDYKQAEQRGYIKLDFLNVNLYNQINDEQHLKSLMNKEPPWDMLYDPEFCMSLIHIGNHYNTLISMPEAVNSIDRLAMFLAIIRPAKRHLVGKPWDEVKKTVWLKPTDDSYYFKKAHAISYSHLVVINMNLLLEKNRS